MFRQRKTSEPATGFRVEGLTGLSKNASRFVRQHPRQARMAVVAALEAAAVQYEAGTRGTAGEVPDVLKPFVVHKPLGSDLMGVSEAAEHLQISRTTVYDWVEKKILLGWKSTRRGLRIPAEQIIGPGKVVPGISKVLDVIGDPELAWAFLSEEWPFANDVARPIDKLKAGEVEAVVAAAPSFGMAFT